jgi:hypothetical protein
LTGNAIVLLYNLKRNWALSEAFIAPELRPHFGGGSAALMLVRYTHSNVGPYDEALFIPGRFVFGGRRHFSISRIVVSTMRSVVSGRANWAILKDLAEFYHAEDRFAVTIDGRKALEIAVRPCGPPLPLDTAWSPLPVRIAQRQDDALLVTHIRGRGAGRLAHIEALRVDPALFPDTSALRPLLALHVSGFTLEFPPPERMSFAK